MKRKKNTLQINKAICFLLFAAFILMSDYAFSQGAAINTTGVAADPSAILDVSSNNSGVLIPRMTEAQKNSIITPATGLMIFQTDATTGFWYYDGTAWMQSIGVAGATGATGATGSAGTSGLLPSGTSAGNTPYWDGTQWVVSSSNIFNNGGSVGIGTSSPDASALIDLSSTSKGTLITRLTTSERDLITSPAQGLQIFNTTTNCLEIFISPLWQPVYCGCTSPSAPNAASHVSTATQITWNWNTVTGASGYKYNTTNDYITAIDNSLSTSYTQSALNCETTYYLYVWAYSICGNSTVSTMAQITSACWNNCGSAMPITHNAGSVAPVSKSINYGTVSTSMGGSGTKCWLTQNLGSSNQATSANDATEAAAGWYWQFNKKQGYKHDGAVRTPNTSWVSSVSETSNWTSANDPCTLELGLGWRLPTSTEWTSAITGWTSVTNAYSSVLKLHTGGFLLNTDGTLTSRGSSGYGRFWSGSQNSATNGAAPGFGNSLSYMSDLSKSYGFAIRCLKD